MTTLQTFCRHILESPTVDDKLQPPDRLRGTNGAASRPEAARVVTRPERSAGLAMGPGVGRLPRPGALSDPRARAQCLARFAHHELMAVELFAWALLRWPELPVALQRGLLRALEQEQVHCRLYLARLGALGAALTDFDHSDYFWKCVPAISRSPHGVRAFLCAMGLTFEQANLDFTLLYRDAFRGVGDEDSAQVCQRVHDDEVEHVRLAAHWNLRLHPGATGATQRDAYARAVPFPLSAARAKGRRFSSAARRRAGLSAAFIEYIRTARSSAETAGPRSGPAR